MVVYSTDQGNYRSVAERIADERGEPLVSDLSEHLETTAPIIYVDPPEEVAETTLQTLQERLLNRGPNSGTFTAVTGLSADTVEGLYYGDGDHGRGDALVSESLPEIETESETTVLASERATVPELRTITTDRLRHLALHAPGWPIHVGLADGVICGYPNSHSPDSFVGSRPFCVSDEGIDCPLDEDLFFAEDVDASHVLFSSCAPVIDNATTGSPVHVGLQLLEGADSLIGTYRLGASHPSEILLHYCLFRSGYSLVERCHLLNHNAKANDIMYLPYVPFGRPDAAIDTPVDDAYTATVESTTPTRLRLEDVDAYTIDLRLQLADFSPTGDRYYVRHRTSDHLHDTLYYVAFQENDELRLLLYTGGRIRADRLELDVSPKRASARDRDVAFSSIENARRNRSLNIIDNEVVEQVRGLWQQTRTIPHKTFDERFDAEKHHEIDALVSQLTGNADVIRNRLVEKLRDGSYVMDHYTNRAVDGEEFPSSDSCNNCGRPVYVKQATDEHGTYRCFGLCPRCGFRFDVPTEPGDDSPHRPTLRVEDSVEGPLPVTVTFDNENDSTADVTVFLSVRTVGNTNSRGKHLFSPERFDTRVKPGETVTAKFDFNADRVYENQHFLIAHVIANLEVYSVIEIVQTRDSPGYVHSLNTS